MNSYDWTWWEPANLVVKPFVRNQNVWEFREINYFGWWNVGLCVQSWPKATISPEEFRIVTQAKEAWQRRLNVKTIVITFFLVFKQWVGSCTRPFYRICENHCERNDQNLAGTQPVYLPWGHSCAHCILYSVFNHKKHSRLFLVSKLEGLNGHGFESATRIQENYQCIKPSFLQHCMWNAGAGGMLIQEGTVLKGALFNQICVLYIAVYLIISRTFWTVIITEITALYRPSVTNCIFY